jgi:2-C-methyl-D-erythritol 4-phosphate cytidylyltransferase / 2-C-methyl-D-erythritol 2,4-cyclodiphosphate synthase
MNAAVDESNRLGLFGVVIVAAGRGVRAGAADGPKQFRTIGGKPIISRTVGAFATHPRVGPIVVVRHPDDMEAMQNALGDLAARVALVPGAVTRQTSTLAGLRYLAGAHPDCGAVMINDGVRPFVSAMLLDRVCGAVTNERGAIPALPVSDTLKRCGAGGTIAETVSRSGLYAAQTPQAFPFAALLEAHEKAAAAGRDDFTDDAAIAEWAGIDVAVVAGEPDNVKLTWARDIAMADERLGGTLPDVRTGNGYDVHGFASGDHVTLCGVHIPHDQALSGHSDADVALHALTDALLATCGAGDIGDHFPPSDPQWKGAASRAFLERAALIVREHGGRIANADVTLIAEAPRIGPYRVAMRGSMADILGIDIERCSVKATTNEKLGFVGRREGIAAIATVTAVFPGRL